MHFKYRITTIAATGLLGLVVAGAWLAPPSVASLKASSDAKLIGQGKAIAAAHCAGCHGADMLGRPHFAPPITSKGELRHYTVPLFERVMAVGLDNDGKMVRKPMPVFKFPKAQSDAVYAYLESLH